MAFIQGLKHDGTDLIISLKGEGAAPASERTVLAEDGSGNFTLGSGSVGIGTDNPSAKLDIVGGTSDGLEVDIDGVTSGDTVALFKSNGNNLAIVRGNGRFGLGAITPDAPLHVQIDTEIAVAPPADTIGLFASGNGAGEDAAVAIISNGAGGDGESFLYLGDHSNVSRTYIKGGRSGHLRFTTESVTDAMSILNNGNVGIGTATPNASAKLDITSTTGAVLFPRMNTTQRGALTPVDGMVIYNTTDSKLQVRAGGAWINLH